MNAVVYYSNSNESYKIAQYLSDKSTYQLIDVRKNDIIQFDNLILVFPVYCQNIPYEVKEFVKYIKVNNISLIATYGKKSFGNVIYEISKENNNLNIISYAYVPTKHTYIDNDFSFNDFDKLKPLVEKFNNPKSVVIKKYNKNPFANIMMLKRSQNNIKIIKTQLCNECGLCNKICSNIDKGYTNNKCIRCLRCVNSCPAKALKINKSFFLGIYLRVINKNKLIIKV